MLKLFLWPMSIMYTRSLLIINEVAKMFSRYTTHILFQDNDGNNKSIIDQILHSPEQ